MNPIAHVLNRHPLAVSGAILLLLAMSVAAVTHYVQEVVRPRHEAALVKEIGDRTIAAGALLKRGRFEPALIEFRGLLAEHGERLSAGERGRLHHQIGASLAGLGQKNGDKEMLNNALGAFQDALALRPPETDAGGFAESQLALASLHRTLANQGSPGDHLADAIAAYRAALGALTAQALPEAHGRAQRDLGNTYREQFAADARDGAAESAQRAYSAALAVFTKESHPREYAETMVDKGLIALEFGKAAYTRTRTREAIDALEQALATYQRLEDARAVKDVYRNLAAAYLQIAEVEDRTGMKMKYMMDARRATYLADGASVSDKAAIDAGSGRLRATD